MAIDEQFESRSNNCSSRARRATWYKEPDRPLEMNIVLEAANRLHSSSKATIEANLDKVQALFSAPGSNGIPPTPPVVGTRFKLLVDSHILCPRLKKKVKTYVNENFKKSRGNRSKYKRSVLDDNDKVTKLLWTGRRFLVHIVPPADGEVAEDFDFQGEEWSQYQILRDNYYINPKFFSSRNGLKERVYDRQKKGNTNHKKRRNPSGKRGIVTLQKVYIWMDDPTREPIVSGKSAAMDRGDRSTTLYLCYLEDRGDDDDKEIDTISARPPKISRVE